MTALVIVESPAKAKTIAGYLGDDYVVESSIGHVRDLPRGAADVPAAYKGEKWARIGIDVDNDFKPLYVVSSDKKDQIKKLKKLLKESDELYLATDEDREGEAIAWHLLEVLNPQVPVKRMVFHEITKTAIEKALNEPRELDRHLVDAQEARRMLDRLYGYEVSPVLWKKIMPKLSAGRVQSVATRIVVERERERMAFIKAGYWDLSATFENQTGDEKQSFTANLQSIDGQRVASGRDFEQDGSQKNDDVVVLTEATSAALAKGLDGVDAKVNSVEPKPYRRRPAAPFITSTYQQEAGRKLRVSSAMAMRAAQGLYEKGYITYMRTDSTTLSETALNAARSYVKDKYGDDYLPDEARTYAKKVKNAQEAHEAIRPAGDTFKTPEQVAAEVPKSEAAAYELIFNRTVASQMTDCLGETVSVKLGAKATTGEDAEFSASGTVITHQGFRKIYTVSKAVDAEVDEADNERKLPAMTVGDALDMSDIVPEGHETQPPSRYTEASLVKKLEELGVGRPSTFASIMGTIQDRGYVWKKGSAMVPSFTAFSVVGLLEGHFPDLVDYAFTAKMETDLDAIAGGSGEAIPWLTKFYFGEGEMSEGLKKKVDERLGEIDARAINTIPLGVSEDGEAVVARVGKFGPYVQAGEAPSPDEKPRTASIPDDLAPDELTVEKAMAYIEAPSGDKELGIDPESGLMVYAKAGRFGPYVQLGEIVDGEDKPKTGSLFTSMSLDTITYEEAMKLLSLPRLVGVDPSDGKEINVQNGRYGPYLKKGKDSRSMEKEEDLFTITLDECLKLLAQPKRRGGGTAKPPLREDLGEDPETGKEMICKDGRFGPYVTDGEYNASLRKGDTVEELTSERAAELLAERRAKGPAKKGKKAAKKKKKATAKKKSTAKKKATAKKTAAKKKTPAKKKAAAAAEPADESAEETPAE